MRVLGFRQLGFWDIDQKEARELASNPVPASYRSEDEGKKPDALFLANIPIAQSPTNPPYSLIGVPAPSFTRSRKSLPGLKCGTYLPASATVSPVLGLRP